MAPEAKPREVGPMKPEEVLRLIAAQRGSAICRADHDDGS